VIAGVMPFESVVFSGGGCRCFWQAGFWSVVAPAIDLRPKTIAAVSAGSAFACAAVGGKINEVVAAFVRRTGANRRNFYPGNSLRRQPMFPHGQMYRATILETTDAAMLARIAAGPDIRVSLARPPRRVPLLPALAAGFFAYRIDRLVRRGVHPTLTRYSGFRSEFVSARTCQTPEQLADLILHSSCMPPLMPMYRRDGRHVIDGGIIDGTPIAGVGVGEDTPTLVLLSRRIRGTLPVHADRLYVQPSVPVPIAMWDYASPRLIERTFDLGRRDGEAFAAGYTNAASSKPRMTTSANAPNATPKIRTHE
jgi:predicted acylesterase/phospholipase RssA